MGMLSLRGTLLVAIGALSVGCGDATSPDELTCPSATAALCTAPAEVLTAAKATVSDIAVRSTKGLSNVTARTALATEAAALAAALQDGRVSRAREALDAARAAVADAKTRLSTHPGDAPDLSAIELSLLHAARLLQ